MRVSCSVRVCMISVVFTYLLDIYSSVLFCSVFVLLPAHEIRHANRRMSTCQYVGVRELGPTCVPDQHYWVLSTLLGPMRSALQRNVFCIACYGGCLAQCQRVGLDQRS